MEKEKTLTVSSVFAWIFGVVFLLTGLTNIISDTLVGISFMLASLFILPPVYDLIKKKSKINLSKGLRILIALVFISIPMIFMGDISNDEVENTDTGNNSNQTVTEEVKENSSEEQDTSTTETVVEEQVKQPEPAPKVENVYQPTLGERNAVKAAKNYLSYTSFSKSGLIDQLEFEGYSKQEAEYGVDQTNADWNQQAALKAESYLGYTSFSRSSLIEQLVFEGFTRSQAEYGASAVGY